MLIGYNYKFSSKETHQLKVLISMAKMKSQIPANMASTLSTQVKEKQIT